MNPKIILKLSKVILFISFIVGYGYLVGIKSQILFALILTMYLIELYKGGKQDG